MGQTRVRAQKRRPSLRWLQPCGSAGQIFNRPGLGMPSLHEFTNIATHRAKLRAIHSADYVADDGGEYLFRRTYAEAGRLFDEKTHLGELERSDEVVIQAAPVEFHNDIRERIAMLRAVFGFFDSRENRQRLRTKAV